MTFLRNSILATVIYYDCFDCPLTLPEIHKYLINPVRLQTLDDGIGEINLDDIRDKLEKLVRPEFLGRKNGYYFLAGREELYEVRLKRRRLAYWKWRKFFRYLKFLPLSPYLRGIFASGSLALDNTDAKSDFDVLIIAKSGRLYTCRLFLWLISSILGIRRKPHEKVAPDKLCFNHYITDDNLHISHHSIFNAQTYINLRPAMISPELVDKFFTANIWLNNYCHNFKSGEGFVRRSVVVPFLFKFFAKGGELILGSFLGDWLEKIARSFQQKKIKKNPITYESGGRVVFTDQELEFHPYSFEKVVLAKYNTSIKHYGIISSNEEKDSGLL